jgi:lipopolysaccharide transport system permease protein
MLARAYAQSTGELIRTVRGHLPLLTALARRDISDDYVGHGLAVAWPVIQPLFAMAVYLFCFTWVFPARIQAPPGLTTDAIVYLLAGIIPWLTLSQVMARSLASVVSNASIVKQVAFPLELLPLKTLMAPLLFGAVALACALAYATWTTGGVVIPVYLWGIPLLIAISLVLFSGLALLLSCLHVFSRDVREIVTLFLTIGLFIHPILYFPGAVPAAVRPLLYLSPFSYFLFCWQDILFYGGIERPWAWAATVATAMAVFALGARVFVGSKPYFGDFL